MIAALVDQWIGVGLIVFFAGFVAADATRPKTRYRRVPGRGPKTPPKLKIGERSSGPR